MTGLEIVVLAPLAYGILHLGKKVVEQRQIIDNQIEAMAQQQLALDAAREGGAAAGANGGVGADTLLGKAMMVGSLSIAGAMTAYNFYQISSRRNRRGDYEDGSSADNTPNPSATNTLTSSTAGGGSSSSSRRRIRTREPPANYAPQEARSESEECKVCMHYQRDTLVMPCNHFALCWGCAEEIRRRQQEVMSPPASSASASPSAAAAASSHSVGQCPVCRVPITSLQFAYV